MIKMTRVYGDMYVPREYCTFTNPVTSGGTEEVDYVDMPCENGCEKECENCTLQKIMNEYARLTRQDIDEKKRHCEECENYKEIRKGPRGGKKGICRILRPSEVRNGRARACKRFREQEVDFSGLKVPFVAVYGHPDDFPDKYVARIYELDRATDTIMVKETLEEIEMDIKEHTAMTFIPRGTADVPSLVGVWM